MRSFQQSLVYGRQGAEKFIDTLGAEQPEPRMPKHKEAGRSARGETMTKGAPLEII